MTMEEIHRLEDQYRAAMDERDYRSALFCRLLQGRALAALHHAMAMEHINALQAQQFRGVADERALAFAQSLLETAMGIAGACQRVEVLLDWDADTQRFRLTATPDELAIALYHLGVQVGLSANTTIPALERQKSAAH